MTTTVDMILLIVISLSKSLELLLCFHKTGQIEVSEPRYLPFYREYCRGERVHSVTPAPPMGFIDLCAPGVLRQEIVGYDGKGCLSPIRCFAFNADRREFMLSY